MWESIFKSWNLSILLEEKLNWTVFNTWQNQQLLTYNSPLLLIIVDIKNAENFITYFNRHDMFKDDYSSIIVVLAR